MIGIFDSGSGGLSVLSAVRVLAPKADIAYFGDIANAPYGVRSANQLASLTKADVQILKSMGATEIVSACNSVSPAIIAGAAGETPVIEMTQPTAKGLRRFAGKKVLLIATPATIDSKIYQNALGNFLALDPLPIAELAGAIEFGSDDNEISRIMRNAFEERRGNRYDTLLLGCTHYPLVRGIIEREARQMFGLVECIDPAKFVADEVVRIFNTGGSGKMIFRISKDSTQFRSRVSGLFPKGNYLIEVGV